MEKITILLALILTNVLASQTFDVETIYNSGDDEKRINLVILSDGYQESELAQFIVDATSFSDELFSQRPFLEYKNYFNVYAIKVPSNESGADHPGTATDVNEPVHPVIDVDNYFGSTFDYANIHRLLVPVKTGVLNAVLANNFPLYDQVIILVNTPYYGGSGGQYATASLESSANEIAIHELGHSFSNLRDEYWAGNQYAAEAINMTQETDPSLVRWINWMGDGGIGIFQHCCGGNSALWYRPHQNCKMRVLGPPLCSVCVEGTIEKIHSLITPIDAFTPITTSIIVGPGTDIDFTLDLNEPVPVNTLSTNWLLNGALIDSDVSSITLTESDLEVGNNDLVVFVEDVTDLLRVDNHSSVHIYTVTWNIEFDPLLGIVQAEGTRADITITAYPNPVSNMLNVSFDNPMGGAFSVSIYSIDGKLIRNATTESQDMLQVDMAELEAGVYIVKYYLGNAYVSSQKIIKN